MLYHNLWQIDQSYPVLDITEIANYIFKNTFFKIAFLEFFHLMHAFFSLEYLNLQQTI